MSLDTNGLTENLGFDYTCEDFDFSEVSESILEFAFGEGARDIADDESVTKLEQYDKSEKIALISIKRERHTSEGSFNEERLEGFVIHRDGKFVRAGQFVYDKHSNDAGPNGISFINYHPEGRLDDVSTDSNGPKYVRSFMVLERRADEFKYVVRRLFPERADSLIPRGLTVDYKRLVENILD